MSPAQSSTLLIFEEVEVSFTAGSWQVLVPNARTGAHGRLYGGGVATSCTSW